MPIYRQRQNTLSSWPNPTANQFPDPNVFVNAPSVYDEGEVGQIWVQKNTNNAWILTQQLQGQNIWTPIAFSNEQATYKLQTNDDNPHAIFTYAIPANTIVNISAQIVGRRQNDVAVTGGFINGTAQLFGGLALMSAAPTLDIGNNGMGGLININTEGANIRIIVIGNAAQVWNWTAAVTMIQQEG